MTTRGWRVKSDSGFGDAGFYFVVRKNETEAWAKYLLVTKKHIRIYVDQAGDLRTGHILKLWGASFLKLHYRMQKANSSREEI